MSFISRLFSRASPDPARRYVGTFNSFMRPGSGGCMRGEIMTPAEEYDFTRKLLESIELRPEDWKFDRYVATDTKTGISIWISNHVEFVRIYHYRHSDINLRQGSQRRIWDALHKMRHRSGTETGQRLNAALTKANAEKRQACTVKKLAEQTNIAVLPPAQKKLAAQ